MSTREKRENPNIWADGPGGSRACTILVTRDCSDSVGGRRRDPCASALVYRRQLTSDGGAVHDSKYLSEHELSALLKVSTRTIQRWRASGDGPPFIRVGAKSIRYELSSCKTWTEQRTFNHHAQELTARKS